MSDVDRSTRQETEQSVAQEPKGYGGRQVPVVLNKYGEPMASALYPETWTEARLRNTPLKRSRTLVKGKGHMTDSFDPNSLESIAGAMGKSVHRTGAYNSGAWTTYILNEFDRLKQERPDDWMDVIKTNLKRKRFRGWEEAVGESVEEHTSAILDDQEALETLVDLVVDALVDRGYITPTNSDRVYQPNSVVILPDGQTFDLEDCPPGVSPSRWAKHKTTLAYRSMLRRMPQFRRVRFYKDEAGNLLCGCRVNSKSLCAVYGDSSKEGRRQKRRLLMSADFTHPVHG